MASTPAKKPTTKKPTTKKPSAKAPSAKAPKQANNSARAARRRPPTHDAIEKRAYELSLQDGTGDTVSHWLQAERELSGS